MRRILPRIPLTVAEVESTFGIGGHSVAARDWKETSVPASDVLAFWLVALVLIVCPGADWAFTISAGARSRSMVPAVGGLLLGYLAVTLVVATGVGALVAGSPAILTGLTVVGGAYLIWHGATTFARPSPPGTADALAGRDGNLLVKGMGVSGLNPKGLLIFLALLPQFTDPHDRWPVAAQIGLLGLAFVATCGVFYTGLGIFARRMLHERPSAAHAVSRVAGAAMVVIGALLLIERLVA
jgi:threonine/homoserine/homoserine lactone efflux protein